MKKLIALLLSAAVLSASAAMADYSDVGQDAWFYDAVNSATENEWFTGYEDGSFKPDNNISRAEAAKVLVTYKYGSELPDTADEVYPDIDGTEWYAQFVNISGAEDIIPSDESFEPSEPITREDTVVGMLRALGMEPSENTAEFTDSSDISDYALGYITAASESGIINGYDDGSFGPKLPVTRAEFAQILMNANNTAVLTPSPDVTAEPSASPEPSAAAEPTASPAASPTAEPTADPNATATPSPTPVPITEEFKDKSIYVLGDNMLAQNTAWLQIVKDNLAPESMTHKTSGSYSFSNVTTNTYTNALSNVPEDTDYLIIMGGRYEWEYSRAIGDETSVQESDFTGAVRSFIDNASRRLPDTTLMLMTLPNITNSKVGFTESGTYNAVGMSAADYSARIRLVCEETGTAMIDLNSQCWTMGEIGEYLEYSNMSYLTTTEAGDERLAEVITEGLIEINAQNE